MPHLDVQDIRQVNWAALRAAGFHGCVFDKVLCAFLHQHTRPGCADVAYAQTLQHPHLPPAGGALSHVTPAVGFAQDNTLTLPYVLEVHPPLRASLDDCRAAFGDRLAILSNSAGLHQYDPDGTLANALERGLSIPVLRHGASRQPPQCPTSGARGVLPAARSQTQTATPNWAAS
jgi:hypothetical protein